MYRITINPTHQLVEVTLGDMMSLAETKAYVTELKAALVSSRMRPGYRMIIDVCDCPIQQQDVIRTMGEHMAEMPKASAIAVVTGSSLSRMQVRRLMTQPYVRIVSTRAEGRAWVLEGTEPQERAAART